ncbi:hypothetical protein [Pantoea allii]
MLIWGSETVIDEIAWHFFNPSAAGFIDLTSGENRCLWQYS